MSKTSGVTGRYGSENGYPFSEATKASNPSEYGFLYSAERPKPAPEVGWKDRVEGEPATISLYSENVVKEEDTTDSVDRESIANLSSTKEQWENIFTSNFSPEGRSSEAAGMKKKAQPKWEVRLPYKEKHVAPSQTSQTSQANTTDPSSPSNPESEASLASVVSSSGPHEGESAIEREIRLAHEREEMLRLEKAERAKPIQHQLQHQQPPQAVIGQQGRPGQQHPMIMAYDAASAESESYHHHQPAFEELAEADRGPELWGQQQARGRDGAVGVHQAGQEEYGATAEQTEQVESIIEREIRLQQEREAEVARMRKLSGAQTPRLGLPEQQQTSTPDSSHTAAQLQSPGQLLSPQAGAVPSWQRDVSPFVPSTPGSVGHRRSSQGSASSHSTSGTGPLESTPSRSVHAQRLLVEGEEEEEKPDYFKKQETPIEREMRIARERENDLRRQKGLPEVSAKGDDYYSSYGAGSDQANGGESAGRDKSFERKFSAGSMTPRSATGDTVRRFATNRLQQELMQQKEREMALRSEGKIISTSEEHIQPLKYTEVAGVDQVDGTEKRNFVTASGKTFSPLTSPETDTLPNEVGESPGSGAASRKKSSVLAGGQLFSYKEFKQTAESKIERELREMREREEELKHLRVSNKSESPP